MMTPTADHLVLWGSVGLNLAACAFSISTSIRAMRNWRLASRIRVQTFALEKQLLDQGAQLPTRCVMCCQVLPAHVEGCTMEDHYRDMGWVFECLTRPPIKYYAPPKWKGKSQ